MHQIHLPGIDISTDAMTAEQMELLNAACSFYVTTLSRLLAEAERVLANIDSGTPDYREQAAKYFRDREGEKEEGR